MKITLTIGNEVYDQPGGRQLTDEQLADLVDTGRRNPEDCWLVIKHQHVVIEAIEVEG